MEKRPLRAERGALFFYPDIEGLFGTICICLLLLKWHRQRHVVLSARLSPQPYFRIARYFQLCPRGILHDRGLRLFPGDPLERQFLALHLFAPIVVVADLAAPWPFWGTDEVNNRNKGQNPSILFWCWPSTVPQHCQTTHYPCQEDVDRYGVKSNALAFFHGSEYTLFL